MAITEHRIREGKEDAAAAAKETSAKQTDKTADGAAAGGEDSKGEEQKQDGSAGPDTANGGF